MRTTVIFTQRWMPYIQAKQKAEDERIFQSDCTDFKFHNKMIDSGFNTCPFCGDYLNEKQIRYA